MRIAFVALGLVVGACTSTHGATMGQAFSAASGTIAVNGSSLPLDQGGLEWASPVSPPLGGDGFSFCLDGDRFCLQCRSAGFPASSKKPISLLTAACMIALMVPNDACDAGTVALADTGDGAEDAGRPLRVPDAAPPRDSGECMPLLYIRHAVATGTLATNSHLEDNGNGSLIIDVDIPTFTEDELEIEQLHLRGTVFFGDDVGCRAPPLQIP